MKKDTEKLPLEINKNGYRIFVMNGVADSVFQEIDKTDSTNLKEDIRNIINDFFKDGEIIEIVHYERKVNAVGERSKKTKQIETIQRDYVLDLQIKKIVKS